MKIQGIDHVSINVKDMRASVEFYGKVLGFRQAETVDMGDCRITYFGLPGGGRLELFDYNGANRDSTREESDVGLRHLAFTVSGVADHEKTLRSRGVSITLPTTELPALGARVLLFLDPNGVTLEFCERL